MKYQLRQSTVAITCTQAELDRMDKAELALYGTPNADAPGEPISQVYIADKPSWKYDRFLAFAEDFEDAGWLYEDVESGQEYTITIPRYLPE